MTAVQDPSPWLPVFGRSHMLLLHLPIGLWIGTALLEFGGALCRRPVRGAVIALAWFAAVMGALAAASGWVLAEEGANAAAAVDRHRWSGVAVAVAGALCACFAALARRVLFRTLLLATLGLLVLAGHFGAELTHGEGFLLEPMRERDATPAPVSPGAPVAGAPDGAPSTNGAASPPAAPPADHFAAVIAPILERTCIACHGPKKQKGELRLDSAAAIEAGGENGRVVVPGKPEESELLRRVRLPAEDEDHMPPVDPDAATQHPQPAESEIAALHAWIAAGAPFTGPLPGGGSGGLATAPGAAQQPPPASPASSASSEIATPTPAAEPAAAVLAAVPPADEKALAALRDALVHVQPIAPGSDRLWIDVAAAAATFDDAAAARLLEPLRERVEDLGLARSLVTDATAPLLARMPALRRLDLRGTAFTSAGLAQLGAHPRLEELVLAQTRLDDAAVESLLALPALAKVHVWSSGLSADALARLRARDGLAVEDGEAKPPAGAPEPEPPVKFTSDLPPLDGPPVKPTPPVPAQANGTAGASAPTPANTLCPVSGKPADPRFVVLHQGQAIAFCCADCPKTFWLDPAKYPVATAPPQPDK